MEFYGATDKGIVRKENQDVFLCEDVRITGGILLAVCDGMGGAKAGHIASTMGLNVFRDSFFKDLDPFYDEKAIAQSLVNAIQQANTEIYRRSCTDPECSGMGTTLVAVSYTHLDVYKRQHFFHDNSGRRQGRARGQARQSCNSDLYTG